MPALFETQRGKIICDDARRALQTVDSGSVDLIVTSPPYALNTEKCYGNPTAAQFSDWFLVFAREFYRILKDSGSLVINIGGAWTPKLPTRSLYRERLLLKLADELRFHLAQELFWFVPGRIDNSIEYVTRHKIRLRDSIETIWWLCRTPNPKADTTKVLLESMNMQATFLKSVGAEHELDGRLPTNLLYLTNSDREYNRRVEAAGLTPHHARFPQLLPAFFIKLLTDVGDLVVDPFAGSCTAGYTAEQLKRRWVCIELSAAYAQSGVLRFKS